MKIVVSACLLGENCKYNGGNNDSESVKRLIEGHVVVPVCPEMIGGLPCPRSPGEIVDGRVINKEGESMDESFRKGAAAAMELVKKLNVDAAILQPRSPSCGAGKIYDGTFSGKLIPGNGVFAELLIKDGFTIRETDSADYVLLVKA